MYIAWQLKSSLKIYRKNLQYFTKVVDAVWGSRYTLENRWKNMEIECENKKG